MTQRMATGNRAPRPVIKSDIVFSLDISKSMDSVIEGLKNNIEAFLGKLKAQSQGPSMDLRFSLVAHKWVKKRAIQVYQRSFVSDAPSLISALGMLTASGDEASLPAIDMAVDSPWRVDAHKFVIHFTNETIGRGWDPEKSAAMVPRLMRKFNDLRVALFLVAKACPEFSALSSGDRCEFIEVRSNVDFSPENFSGLMNDLQRAVSTKSREPFGLQQGRAEQDLFKLRGTPAFEVILM